MDTDEGFEIHTRRPAKPVRVLSVGRQEAGAAQAASGICVHLRPSVVLVLNKSLSVVLILI
jgi:hypothetical protein